MAFSSSLQPRLVSLSSPDPLSLSLSLSLPLGLTFSLLVQGITHRRSPVYSSQMATRVDQEHCEGADHPRPSLAVHCGAANSRWQIAVLQLVWRQLLVPTSSFWPPLQNGTIRSRRKCLDHQHTFLCKKWKLSSWSEPNEALFWGNNFEFILVTKKKTFQRYIIYLCLKLFAKKSHFSRQSLKLTVKVLSRFTCRANWDSESKSETTIGLILAPQI